ncbi:MAG TPA: hypothetical protein VGG64_29580 [Pirellulales bacterium]
MSIISLNSSRPEPDRPKGGRGPVGRFLTVFASVFAGDGINPDPERLIDMLDPGGNGTVSVAPQRGHCPLRPA